MTYFSTSNVELGSSIKTLQGLPKNVIPSILCSVVVKVCTQEEILRYTDEMQKQTV